MFDIGFAEIFLLSLIGLLVLGPERLPGVARTVGGFVRKARMSWVSLRRTIEAELAEADLSEPIKKASQDFKQIGKDLADMPGFTDGKLESLASKPGSETNEKADVTKTAASKPDLSEGPNPTPGPDGKKTDHV